MKPIAYFEQYAISENGKIISLSSGKTLTPIENLNGYLKISLVNNDGQKQLLIHRIVAQHYLPNPYEFSQVNHINGNKKDNRAQNLEWISAAENIKHALKTGLIPGFMSVTDREMYLQEVLQGTQVNEIALRIGRRPETLHKMLRETAKRLGIHDQWETQMKANRRAAAIRNLKKVNS